MPEINRSNLELTDKEIKFLEFLRENTDKAFLCLQDFPLYRLKILEPYFTKLGLSVYANVFGLNDSQNNVFKKSEGHYTSMVTLCNTKIFDGYKVEIPKLSLTPHKQGTIRTSRGHVQEGERQDYVDAYGENSRAGGKDYHAMHTFNTGFKIQGIDGTKVINIGNTYMPFASTIMERRLSTGNSLRNLNNYN